MPLPNWATIGEAIYPRPPEGLRINRESVAYIVYIRDEEVHLNSRGVVFTVDTNILARDWMPSSEAEPLLQRPPPGVVHILAGEPEFVGSLPLTPELVPIQPANPTSIRWLQTGVRLQPLGEGPGGVIVGVTDNGVHIRDVERWDTTPLQLGTTVRVFTPQEVLELYRPAPPPMPSWFAVGSRIIQNHDQRIYIILSFSPETYSMRATLEDEVRPISFSVNDFARHWRPASSIVERRPASNNTPLVPSRVQVAPAWLIPGTFLRKRAAPPYLVTVTSLDPEHFLVRLTQVAGLNPLKLGPTWEETEYCKVEEQFNPVDCEGIARSEYKCPKCGETGARDKDAEERRLIEKVRAYTCKQEHTWYFIDGTDYDGQPAIPTRFERDIGI